MDSADLDSGPEYGGGELKSLFHLYMLQHVAQCIVVCYMFNACFWGKTAIIGGSACTILNFGPVI
jgi:hypothetical protein